MKDSVKEKIKEHLMAERDRYYTEGRAKNDSYDRLEYFNKSQALCEAIKFILEMKEK